MDERQRLLLVHTLQSWWASAAEVVRIVTVATALYTSTAYWTQEYHNSALSGQAWVTELIHGHPDRIHCELGVRLHVFVALLLELRSLGCGDSRNGVLLEEQLAIFLYTCVTGLSVRHVGERFQRANETITNYFTLMLNVFSSPAFYNKFVRLPSGGEPTPDYIRHNPKLFPFLRNCLGAIDGSHIACSPPSADRSNMRNRKGFLSQNVLAVCNFSLHFVYILAGWDGSVTDSFLYGDARVTDLRIPPGYYYLGDAGFPLCAQILIPYRSTRYHLREWALGNQRPRTKKELYNLRHAQARNIIERIFGVVKKRWQILVVPPHYSMALQARIPAALAALHNFIMQHDPLQDPVPDLDTVLRDAGNQDADGDDALVEGTLAEQRLTDEETEEGKALREEVATAMWEHYRQVLADRGEVIE